ncbi:unnamed protein product [Arctia plantaginis]|uniref:Uncharacterized protein n=1 Tax=Arctia plantaginis TaxID=874455 RepID=A0A8S1AHN2_ARCPL|nr:unnamed protein product [Arctia plantaginis]
MTRSTSCFSKHKKFTYVETKLREGYKRGAARLLFSSLKNKHPTPQDDLSFPEPPTTDSEHLIVTAKEVLAVICSFRSGSAGGLDGLTPQHLKDLVCSSAGEAFDALLKELTALVNLMLSGNVDDGICCKYYSAELAQNFNHYNLVLARKVVVRLPYTPCPRTLAVRMRRLS